MTLAEFHLKYPEMGWLETQFVQNVFVPVFGERGLSILQPQVEISRKDGTKRAWRIDFVIDNGSHKYAIECDGFQFHASGITRERFDELTTKGNEIMRQGYKLIHVSYNQIVNQPELGITELKKTFKIFGDTKKRAVIIATVVLLCGLTAAALFGFQMQY